MYIYLCRSRRIKRKTWVKENRCGYRKNMCAFAYSGASELDSASFTA
jgi:hypothetical protein